MKKLIFLIGIELLCLQILAQKNVIKSLTIGDTVPDITFTNLINHPTKTARLSDFKGKLVILDFWATWCGSCIAHIPKLETLQNEFKDKFKAILVSSATTGDSKEKVGQFMERRNNAKRPISLTVTSEDTLSAKLFPHTAIPHYVWINDKGIVIAVTGAEAITAENIQLALNEEAMQVHTKRDMDKNKRIYLKEEYLPKELLRHYAIFFKGKLLDLQGGGGITRPLMNGNVYDGILFGNSTLSQIYYQLASEILDDFNNDPTRLKYSLADTSGLYFSDYRNKKLSTEWHSKNVVTLELYSPSKTRKELFLKVLDELNNYADYRADIKPATTICYVLKKKGTILTTSQSKQQANAQTTKLYYVWDLKSLIQRLRKEPLPLVNRISSTEVQSVRLPPDIKTIEALTELLSAQGILLEKEEMTLPMLFITKK